MKRKFNEFSDSATEVTKLGIDPPKSLKFKELYEEEKFHYTLLTTAVADIVTEYLPDKLHREMERHDFVNASSTYDSSYSKFLSNNRRTTPLTTPMHSILTTVARFNLHDIMNSFSYEPLNVLVFFDHHSYEFSTMYSHELQVCQCISEIELSFRSKRSCFGSKTVQSLLTEDSDRHEFLTLLSTYIVDLIDNLNRVETHSSISYVFTICEYWFGTWNINTSPGIMDLLTILEKEFKSKDKITPLHNFIDAIHRGFDERDIYDLVLIRGLEASFQYLYLERLGEDEVEVKDHVTIFEEPLNLLFRACRYGHVSIVKFLLEQHELDNKKICYEFCLSNKIACCRLSDMNGVTTRSDYKHINMFRSDLEMLIIITIQSTYSRKTKHDLLRLLLSKNGEINREYIVEFMENPATQYVLEFFCEELIEQKIEPKESKLNIRVLSKTQIDYLLSVNWSAEDIFSQYEIAEDLSSEHMHFCEVFDLLLEKGLDSKVINKKRSQGSLSEYVYEVLKIKGYLQPVFVSSEERSHILKFIIHHIKIHNYERVNEILNMFENWQEKELFEILREFYSSFDNKRLYEYYVSKEYIERLSVSFSDGKFNKLENSKWSMVHVIFDLHVNKFCRLSNTII